MKPTRWHWRCTDCGAWGNGDKFHVLLMVSDHALETGHMLNYWPRGRKDKMRHWCSAEVRYSKEGP